MAAGLEVPGDGALSCTQQPMNPGPETAGLWSPAQRMERASDLWPGNGSVAFEIAQKIATV